MLDSYFVHTCKIYSTTTNGYGRKVVDSYSEVPCWFRDADTLRRSSHNDTEDTDGMLWLPSGTTVEQGQFVEVEGDTYQIDKLTNAKRLGDTTIQFIKCELKKVLIS